MEEDQQPVVDTTEPNGAWRFDAEVTQAFDDMLQRSIPQYEVMRETVTNVASHFIKHRTDVVDLGASRGEAVAPLIKRFGAYNFWHLVEVSDPMADVLEERFKGYIEAGRARVWRKDLRTWFLRAEASVVLSVLTLQFVPIEHRQRIVQQVYDSLLPGGAFLLVEKVLGKSSELDALFVEHYYNLKREHGYSQESIDRKRLSLEGVLVPVTADWNVDLLRTAGFRHVDCIWRWLNFAAWVAVK